MNNSLCVSVEVVGKCVYQHTHTQTLAALPINTLLLLLLLVGRPDVGEHFAVKNHSTPIIIGPAHGRQLLTPAGMLCGRCVVCLSECVLIAHRMLSGSVYHKCTGR